MLIMQEYFNKLNSMPSSKRDQPMQTHYSNKMQSRQKQSLPTENRFRQNSGGYMRPLNSPPNFQGNNYLHLNLKDLR